MNILKNWEKIGNNSTPFDIKCWGVFQMLFFTNLCFSQKRIGQTIRPPLPPKGEPVTAPVPPPRRHRRAGSLGPSPCPSPTPNRQNQVNSDQLCCPS